jgi:elongation factor Ts
MPAITAQMVSELRQRTGVAMMDCKGALTEAEGDLEKAVDLLRKKGQARQDKLAARAATEGRIGIARSEDGKTVALVEINCNTDFTAKSAPVVALADRCAAEVLRAPSARPDEREEIKKLITAAAQQTGENVVVGRLAVVKATGKAGSYLHFTGKLGIAVAFTGNPSEELIKDICFHVAANRPLALRREDVAPEVVAREREIAVEQAKATGKPQEIAEKIAGGKMNAFYQERVLLDQKFVKDDSKTISQVVSAAGTSIESYARLEVGQQ